jgi:4-diphosphocytidyl-2C-methyl-D-erythritol kinase
MCGTLLDTSQSHSPARVNILLHLSGSSKKKKMFYHEKECSYQEISLSLSSNFDEISVDELIIISTESRGSMAVSNHLSLSLAHYGENNRYMRV